MLRFPVSPSKSDDLRRQMAALKVTEGDLVEGFFCPSHGRMRRRGAKIGVHLRHEPSQLEVRCQKSTRQALNRFLARRMLVRLLEKRRAGRKGEGPRASFVSSPLETTEKHMLRMFTRSMEKDIAQPYALNSQNLLGAGNLPPKLIGILGERNGSVKKGERRSS